MSPDSMPIDSRPLSHRAYHRLMEEIVRGVRPAGMHISEESIARELGISRTPAREALVRLAADGLIERLPRRGCRILPLDRELLEDRFACRAMLEELALDLAFDALDRRALEALEADLLAATDADASLAADERLHELILDACPNRSLVSLVRQLQAQCHAVRAIRAVCQPVAPLTEERLNIVRALLAGDRTGAKTQLSRHILGGIDQLINQP